MRQLKIGIIGTRGIPNRYGGFEQFAEVLSAGLVNRGHEVYVYCSKLHPCQEPQWNGVNLIHCKDPEDKLGTAGQFLYDRNCIKDARQRSFDILLHLGYTSDSVWHRKWPKNTINIVNMDGLEWKRSKYNWFTRRFLRWAESLAAKHANILVADSLAIRDHIQKKYNKTSSFIPYSATVFTSPGKNALEKLNINPFEYYLAITRMEPENNIETIIKGYISSGSSFPLLIVGNTNNKYGKILHSRYTDARIVFTEGIYDPALLNNLRYYSLLYFHGHSVGGTNPSLLEAMACSCTIAAHNNEFNKAVLNDEADYFSSANDICAIIRTLPDQDRSAARKQANLEKIRMIYSEEKIVNVYEELMLEALKKK